MLRLLSAGLVACLAYGQSPAVPRFEVASVKPSSPEQIRSGNSGGKSAKGRLTMTNVTLKRCIMGAYALGPNQIIGGPDWLESDRFEIIAKAEKPTDDDADLDAMLRTLLAERFKLAGHLETRSIPALVLEVARNGPKLEKAEGGESSTDNGSGNLVLKNNNMTAFAEKLSRQMDLPVVNQTGLEGVFNMKLQWDPESDKPVRLGVEKGPSVFTAIQEQLGLRLRSQKAPMEVLVIDHAEKPTAN